MKFVLALVLAAGGLTGTAAQAQQLSYAASLRPDDPVEPYLEAWGRDGQYRLIYATTGNGSTLLDRPNAVSQAALSGNGSVQATIGYDLAVAPYSSNIHDSYALASYLTGTASVTLNAGGAAATVTDGAMVTRFEQSFDSDWFSMRRKTLTVNGMLPGNSVAYADPSPQTQLADLTNLLRLSAAGGSPFDLTGFSTLPVRLLGPASYVPVFVGFDGYGAHGRQPWNAALPNPLDLQNFGRGMFMSVSFDGVYTVSVQPEDYADAVDYQRASAWVDANLRQINYEFTLNYAVQTLQVTSVPEPTVAELLLAGLGGLAAAAPRRRWRTRWIRA